MGMYTEIIFGAELKRETPESVITALKYMLGEIEEKPKDFPLPEGRCNWLFQCASYYFGVSKPVNSMWFDDISNTWIISARSNIKNYENEIQTFLKWIKPYISSGSGAREMYAIVTYEESLPEIYYLYDNEEIK